jgi:hypothetical protein
MGISVRKFVKFTLLVCLTVPAVLVAALLLWSWYKTAQIESFYKEHRLLGEIRARQDDSAIYSVPAREALLKRVPLGTEREAAIAMLRSEGFGCHISAEPITARQHSVETRELPNIPDSGRIRKDLVDCQGASPNVLGYKHWIVDLEFDADEHLRDARVTILNIFL